MKVDTSIQSYRYEEKPVEQQNKSPQSVQNKPNDVFENSSKKHLKDQADELNFFDKFLVSSVEKFMVGPIGKYFTKFSDKLAIFIKNQIVLFEANVDISEIMAEKDAFEHGLRTTDECASMSFSVVAPQDAPSCSEEIREKINEIYESKTLPEIPDNFVEIEDYPVKTRIHPSCETEPYTRGLGYEHHMLKRYSEAIMLRDRLLETYKNAKENDFSTQKDEDGLVKKFKKRKNHVIMTEFNVNNAERSRVTVFLEDAQYIKRGVYTFDLKNNKTIIEVPDYGYFEMVDNEYITFKVDHGSHCVKTEKLDLRTKEFTAKSRKNMNLKSGIPISCSEVKFLDGKLISYLQHNFQEKLTDYHKKHEHDTHTITIVKPSSDSLRTKTMEKIIIQDNEIINCQKLTFKDDKLVKSEVYGLK